MRSADGTPGGRPIRRVLIVSGIYPPDIGGPATHAADLAAELRARGHRICVLTLGDIARPRIDGESAMFPRSWPVPVRMAAVKAWIAGAAHRFDVVYATGLHTEAVAGALAARLPVVVKIVGDPVWERARRLGLTEEDFDAFLARPASRFDVRIEALRRMRDWTIRRSSVVVTPSEYLASVVQTWLGGPADVTVIPNGVRVPAEVLGGKPRDAAASLRLVYVGRLIPHKRVERLIEAVARTEGWTLEIIGSGPQSDPLRTIAASLAPARVSFAGDLIHDEVLAHLASADALALASDYEGLPHVVIEALAVGTPVLSPPVGGVPEVVADGVSGLIVAEASVEELSAALARLRDEEGLLSRLHSGAQEAGARWRFERTADGVLDALERAIRGKPRVVFVGKTAMDASAARWRTLVRHTEPVVVGQGHPGRRWIGTIEAIALPQGSPRALTSCLYYAAAPLVGVAKAAAARGPSAVVCQSPYEGAGVLALTRLVPRRARPRVVVEVHGDWRTATRLYGSSLRRIAAPLADRVAGWAVRHADQVRAVGAFTSELARGAGYDGAIEVYTAFGDLRSFLQPEPVEPPSLPSVLFVGALEPHKSVDVLIEAWREVAGRVPGARLTIVGSGAQEDALRRQASLASLGGSVRFAGTRTRAEVRDLMDASSVLVLPSRSEGMGRVILEAFARGRPVVATRVGGIPELVADGLTGSLVPAEDPGSLAKALLAILEDPEAAAEMGRAGRAAVLNRDPALDFEAGIERLGSWAR